MPELKSEFICAMFATLQAPPEVIPVPHGIRVNFYITGGTLDGPRLKGKLRPVGADFFTLRHDGVGELDVRTTIETDDGALIYTHYVGIGDMGVDGHARFLAGELPPKLVLRTGPRFSTAHPKYQWLNRLYCVGVGVADMQTFEVRYDIHALT
ncbi:MAG TPA: DUF3237 domain-containing protein [Solimonas sp.]